MDKADLNVPASKIESNNNDSSISSVEREGKVESNKTSTHSATNSLSSNCLYDPSLYVLLSTATINIRDHFGNLHACRALLDSGSQPNLMSRELCERLKLPQQTATMKIDGINEVSSRRVKYVP